MKGLKSDLKELYQVAREALQSNASIAKPYYLKRGKIKKGSQIYYMVNLKKTIASFGTALLLAQGLPGLMQQNPAQAATYPASMQAIMSQQYPIVMGNQFLDTTINSSVIPRIARDLSYVSINRSSDLFDDLGTSISLANQIHAQNPNVKVLQYLNLIDVWYYEPTSYPWIVNNKAYLKDDAGRIVYPYTSTYGDKRIGADPTNVNWQNYYSQHAKNIVSQGMDGIMSDNWMRSNWQGWDINSTRFTQLEYAWNTVGQKTKAAIGASKILIGNGPAWYTYQNSRDVAMLEMKNAPNATAFSQYLQMSDLAASYGQANQDTVNPAYSESQILNYYLPACLMTDNVFGISNVSEQFTAIEQVGKIGRPTNSRYTSSGILQRDFTAGKVLLNNSSKTVTVSLPAGVYSNVYGTKVNSVTLSSFTGIILKSSGSTPIPTPTPTPTPTPITSSVPAAPSGLASTGVTKNSAGQVFVGLKWQNNATNATSLEILQSINYTSAYKLVKTVALNAAGYSINIGAAPTHGTYYYEVVAVNSAGLSTPSNVLPIGIN